MHNHRSVCIVFVLSLTLGLFSGCRTGHPRTVALDSELRQNAEAAKAAMAAHKPQAAAQFYTAALVRARILDDASEIGRIAYNLAVCLATLNRCEEALPHLSEARRNADKEQAGLIDLAEAKLLLRLGRIGDARRMLAAAETRLDPTAKTAITAQMQLLAASLALAENDAPRARGALALAAESIKAADDDRLRAEFREITGRILLIENRRDEAAEQFAKAADYYRACGLTADMVIMLAEAAAASLAAGQRERAVDLFFRAGRSRHAAGDKVAADELFERAVAAAGTEGESAIRRRIAELAH